MSKVIILGVKDLRKLIKKRIKNRYDCNIIVTGYVGVGKCQPKGSKILMANGSWKDIENIKVGNEVISQNTKGNTTYEKVIALHNRFEEDCYDILEEHSNKLLYSCAGNHEIPLFKNNPLNRCYDYKIINAKNLSKFSQKCKNRFYSLSSFPLEFKSEEPKIEPYSLGVWLGDGHFSHNEYKKSNPNFNKDNTINGYWKTLKSGKTIWTKKHYKNIHRLEYLYRLSRQLGITSDDFDIIKEVSKFYPIMSIYQKKDTTAKNYRFSMNGKLAKQLIELGLEGKGSGTKFIPSSCLIASKKFRLKLLAGIIDTDGYISKNNSLSVTTKSKQLAEDIRNLTFSLGGQSTIKKIKKGIKKIGFAGEYYYIKISFSDNTILNLKVKRKKNRLKKVSYNRNHIYIKCFKGSPSMVYGFSITGKSKLYITDNWMLTHNSTFLYQLFKKFRGFKIEDKLTYKRDEMIKLIRDYKNSYCWADELIGSAFKRNFFEREQIKLIEILTRYRSNFNIVGGALPVFLTLDKELLKLFRVHVQVISRGTAVLHLPKTGRMYSDDFWDTKYNKTLEEKWSKKREKNPLFKIPYHKYSTFKAYIFFAPLTKEEEDKYEILKEQKRAIAEGISEEDKTNDNFYKKILPMIKEGKLSNKDLLNICLFNDKKLSSVKSMLGAMLRDEGKGETLKDFLTKKTNDNGTTNSYNNNTPPPSDVDVNDL